MKLAIIAPVAVPIPVTGYGGIEIEAQWLATEFARRGHDVILMGNVPEGPSPMGWTGLPIETEAAPLRLDRYGLLGGFDVVHDLTHAKVCRLVRFPARTQYWATAMWTDQNVPGRTVYPSEAVRDSFKDPAGPVIPLGVPLDGIAVAEAAGGPYLCLGRVAPYKGQDISIRVAKAMKVPLTVAGHQGAFADPYYALTVRKMCTEAGFSYLPNLPSLEALLDGAPGLLHLHRWLESFSLVVAQALVRGVPVLTTDVGAPQEWVRATNGGSIVPLADVEAQRWEAAGVQDFFERNWTSRRAGIAKRARKLFDIRAVAERYERLYGGALP